MMQLTTVSILKAPARDHLTKAYWACRLKNQQNQLFMSDMRPAI
jgi:hypothetical protein